jgi:phytoene dehydrogenase-like protein
MAAELYDAVVVGSGPNGLAAAITIARSGQKVAVFEAEQTIGGGMRSAELTLPGVVHDLCSAIHPLAVSSPFFRQLELERHGLEWIEPPTQVGHPLDDGSAALIRRDVTETAASLGSDGAAYRRMIGPIAGRWDSLAGDVLAPFHVPLRPDRAALLAWFGALALQPATWLGRWFKGPLARAAFAGCAAHSILSFSEPASGAAALVFLATAHAGGWPMPRGGSARIADALAGVLADDGGQIFTERRIDRLEDLPPHRAALFDVAPRDLLSICGSRLGSAYSGRLQRFRHGPGAFKLDLLLDGPIPWRNAELAGAGTVHLGGTFEEIAASEAEVHAGRIPDRPFVLLAQPSLFDPTRAPAGQHVAWAYCHVPNGSDVDMTERILGQIERFAPGLRDRVLAQHSMGPAQLEAHNANYVGGDIAGGRQDLRQLFTRPAVRLDPYSTPDRRIYLCSASTPPGGGVHGMCGYHAAQSALQRVFRD